MNPQTTTHTATPAIAALTKIQKRSAELLSPDLLAACQRLMKAEEDHRIMAGDFAEVVKARNQCKAAIQRATEGRT